MKKALYFVFAALVLTVMIFHAMPARAVEMIFNGEYRIRAYAFDIDARKDADDSQTYWDQRFRLTMTAKANDNLKGVLRLVAPNNDKWGTQGRYATGIKSSTSGRPPVTTYEAIDTAYDPANPWAGGVEFDLAYLEFDVPNMNFKCRAGKQYISLGNYIVLGSYSTHDALLFTTKLESVDIGVFTAKLYEGATSDGYDVPAADGTWSQTPGATFSEADEDLYGLTLAFNVAPNANLGLFGVMLNDGDTSSGYFNMRDLWDEMNNELKALTPPILTATQDVGALYRDLEAFWLGLTANLEYAPLKMKFEVDYSNAELKYFNAYNLSTPLPNIKLEGYAAFADICADLDFAKVGIAGLTTTGDKHGTENKIEAFFPIASRFSYMYNWDLLVINKYLEGIEGDQCISNLTTLKLYAQKDITEKTSINASLQYYAYTKDPDGPMYEDDNGTRLNSSDDETFGAFGTDLGYEVDICVSHKLYDNLKLSAGVGYWFTDAATFPRGPSDVPVDLAGPDNNWLLKTGVEYTF